MEGLRLLLVNAESTPARVTQSVPECEVSELQYPLTSQRISALSPHVAAVFHTAGEEVLSLENIRCLRAASPVLPILLLAKGSSEAFAIDAFHAGVSRYVKWPWTAKQIGLVAVELCAVTKQKSEPAEELKGSCLIGVSAGMCELRRYIRQVAPSESNVLITGETGTGKELVAQSIHQNSARSLRPFVCLNSAAIPDSLVESELFGYERGAFTGAHTRQAGKLAAANSGTIFFDEIGDVSPGVQAKLLRAIESRSIHLLGSTRTQDVDVRILAATNKDLEAATHERRFRDDLYYRLNVVRVEIPPLRERPDDVPGLVQHYLNHFNPIFRKEFCGLCPAAVDVLSSYSWPGNVRELRNVVEVAFVNSSLGGGMLDLPTAVYRHLTRFPEASRTERTAMLQALSSTSWNKTQAAKALHWSRMTLYRKMRQHKVSTPPKMECQR